MFHRALVVIAKDSFFFLFAQTSSSPNFVLKMTTMAVVVY